MLPLPCRHGDARPHVMSFGPWGQINIATWLTSLCRLVLLMARLNWLVTFCSSAPPRITAAHHTTTFRPFFWSFLFWLLFYGFFREECGPGFEAFPDPPSSTHFCSLLFLLPKHLFLPLKPSCVGLS